MTPQRIQRKRTKGWRMPEGAIYVGRPTKWGNPWGIAPFRGGWSVDDVLLGNHVDVYETRLAATASAVEKFREYMWRMVVLHRHASTELAGHDLACWCPLDQPCHADVLLEIANGAGA